MIAFENAFKAYAGQPVLQDVTFSVAPGERVVLVGPSGSGKSTLLRCVNRLESIDRGTLRVLGQDVGHAKADVRALRQEVGMVFQSFNLFPHLSALENIALAPVRVRGIAKADAHAAARQLLTRVGLAHKADCYPAQLSGGQQQRVAIARSLAMQPQVMLFDEPTSALDPEMVHEVLQVIQDIAREGMTMLVITHEMAFARRVATRALFLDQGRVLEDAPSAEFFARPRTERARAFLSHLEKRDVTGPLAGGA
ncbi:MAG TPA: amino acid ABC transporter ATP-binding protein [Oscillatoriaceae cyanobacterium]